MKTTIPFSGFYYSSHDQELDHVLEYIVSNDRGDVYQSLHSRIFDAIKWQDVHTAYCKAYVSAVAQRFELKIKFAEMTSPREYNFTTDRIFCRISQKEVRRIFKLVDKAKLNELIRARFTSYDGFISFYPNDLSTWPKSPMQWDINHVGTLIQCYIESHEEYSENCLEYPFESSDLCYNLLSDAISAKHFKILDYLRSRDERRYRAQFKTQQTEQNS